MTRLSFALTDEVNNEEIEFRLDESLRDIDLLGGKKEPFSLAKESWLLLTIALPAVAVQFSVLFIFPQTASVVGRQLGTEELAGFSLASLTGNLTILSVMVGALYACDTLQPRAYGIGNYEEVGYLAVRGCVMCLLLLILPIVPLFTAMEWIFDSLGQDPVASALASQWIRVYLLGVPAMLLFRVAQSFLNAQHVVMPLVVASLIACFVIHPVVLSLLIPTVGFIGSGLAIAITNTIMAMIVFLYLDVKPEHDPRTWPRLSFQFVKDAMKPRAIRQFLQLSFGGIFALSEWWFWEINCFIVGSFGIVPLCVHTIAYNLVPLLFMIPLGISIGLTVRMGTVLATDVSKAKQMAAWCMGFTIVVGAIVSGGLYVLRVPIVLLFTNDEEVLQGCVDIWPKLCIYVFVLYIFGINSAILRALGMQWHAAAVVLGCCWCGALPTIVYFAMVRGGQLDALWTVLPFFYVAMQVLLILCYTGVSWETIGQSIREEHLRKSLTGKDLVAETPPSEETPLL